MEDRITEASNRKMVDAFYARVRQDDLLSPVFEKELTGKWDSHLPRMVDFWNKVLLGSGSFQGNVFGKHMALEGIREEHFARWLELFHQTVQETQPAGEVGAVMIVAERIAESLQLGYAQRPSRNGEPG